MAVTTRSKIIPLSLGYATDLLPQERQLTHMAAAENIIFEISGAVRKCGGGTRLNSTAISGTPSILGQFDYWKAGTGGSFTQVYVVTTSDSAVWCEEDPSGASGSFTDRTGGVSIGAGAIPNFVQAKDTLIIFFSDASTPITYNNTGNAAALGGTPPAGRCGAWHKNRLWIGGTNANPSRLYYSKYGTITTWTGQDTGAIDIDSEDGDRIVGLASHKNSLIVLKGPNKGSIHIISGDSPEGENAFRRDLLVLNVPLQTPNSIVPVGDDIWFMSDRAIHSIAATARFGDFEQRVVTQYLFKEFRDNINRTRLPNVWGVNYAAKSSAIWTLSTSGSSTNNRILGLSYVNLEEGIKPFIWTLATAMSAGLRINPTTKLRELIFGDNAGFLNRMDQSDRSMPSSMAYTARITTPAVVISDSDSVGQPKVDQMTTLKRGWLRSQSVGDYNVTLSIARDTDSPESYTFNQGNAGFLLDTDLLDTGVLGGFSPRVSAVELLGECRAATFDITQGGTNQDMNIYELGLEFDPASEHQGAGRP